MRTRRKKLEQGDYGPVHVWGGEHKGQSGYYDDDEGKLAVVYLGAPCLSEYVLIQNRWLEPAERFTSPINGRGSTTIKWERE